MSADGHARLAGPGCQMELSDLVSGERRQLMLLAPGAVPAGSALPAVSAASPLGIALLAKRAGELIEAAVWGGQNRFCALAVTPRAQRLA